MRDVSANGITVDGRRWWECPIRPDPDVSGPTLLQNNYVAHVGQDYLSSQGILSNGPWYLTAEHNELEYGPMNGIGLPICDNSDTYSAAKASAFRYNKVRNFLKELHDSAGFYTHGNQDGLVVFENWFDSINPNPAFVADAGIYVDNLASNMTFTHNVISNYSPAKAIFENVGGTNPHHDVVFDNNETQDQSVKDNAGLEAAYQGIKSEGPPPGETITPPTTLTGPNSGMTGTANAYTTGGASSSLGHTVEYQFDWKGDGTALSAWGSSPQSKTWTAPGTYNVRSRARCTTDPLIVSPWAGPLNVTITSPETISPPTTLSGPPSGVVDTSYSYTTGGASSSLGHPVEYQFDWKGNGTTDLSAWGSSPQPKTWTAPGTYTVRSRARCTTDPLIVSPWAGLLNVTIASPETITPPGTLSGPTSGVVGTANTYTTGGASSSLGHPVEYQFDWKGDASDLSSWGTAAQSKTWTTASTYKVRSRARCSTDKTLISDWAGPLNVTITSPETITPPTTLRGPLSGLVNNSYSYTTGGASSNLGHPVEYQFDWKGDGSDLSSWGTATQSKIWTTASTYKVRSRARCSTDNTVISAWSTSISVSVASVTTQYSLTTSVDQVGAGTVTPSGTNWYNSGTTVVLTAKAAPSYKFVNWSGDLVGTNSKITIVMDSSKTVIANFKKAGSK